MLYLLHDSSQPRTPMADSVFDDFPIDIGVKAELDQDDIAAAKRAAKSKPYISPPPAHPIETHFRHSHWKVKRQKILGVMASCNASPSAIDRYVNCGAACVVEFSTTAKRHRLKASYCHNRHCEPCMRSKANKLARNLKIRLEKEADGRYRFITLTLKHNNAPLQEQIKRLYKCVKNLRATKLWKSTQRGGSFSLEVKRSKSGQHWHPHIHIISEGDFMDKGDLSRLWHKVTGDSQIVDIRALSCKKDAAYYVAKYVTKGTSSEVWNDRSLAQEWLHAIKGVRVCATYGTWRGYKLTESADEANDWKPIGSYVEIMRAADRMEEWAMAIIISICPADKPDERDRPNKKGPGS